MQLSLLGLAVVNRVIILTWKQQGYRHLKRGVHTLFFPVSYSTLSDQAINEFLKNQYGLDGTARTGYLLRGMNDTYLVTTAGQKYVFRVYRGDWRTNESEIVFEMELLQHLDKQGISVSLPIPDRQGNIIQKLQAPEGTRFAVLFTFAEGEERGIDSEEISERFGKDVAGIHLHSASFHSSNTRQELNLDYLISQALDFIHPRMTHREQISGSCKGLQASWKNCCMISGWIHWIGASATGIFTEIRMSATGMTVQ